MDDEGVARPSERMFHVKHLHKRKFLRTGRVLQKVRPICMCGFFGRQGARLSFQGRPLTCRGRSTSFTWRGAVSGAGRPPAFRVREAPNGSPLRRKRRPLQLRVQLQRGFHNPRDHPIVALCRKLPTCVVGLHRADSARRLSRSVGFALEKMANGG